MVETIELPHLPIIKIKEVSKKISSGFSVVSGRSTSQRKSKATEFKNSLDEILKDLKDINENYSSIVSSDLIFKIKVNSRIDREKLEKMNLNVLGYDDTSTIIVFGSEEHLEKFLDKIEDYKTNLSKSTLLDAFDDLLPINPKDRIGIRLSDTPIMDEEKAKIDIEFWYSEDKSQRTLWFENIKKIIVSTGGYLIDRYEGDSYFLIRVKITKSGFDIIKNLKEIRWIDRPPEIIYDMDKIKGISKSDLDGSIETPDSNSPSILLFDSGITPKHPLIENALKVYDSFIDGNPGFDDSGHGMIVAGIALYGDLGSCIKMKKFKPDGFLYSIKVLDSADDFDNNLLVSQIKSTLKQYTDQDANIKIVNLSLGDRGSENGTILIDNHRQFLLAAELDNLVYEYRNNKKQDLIFVISAGNNFIDDPVPGRYPDYYTNSDFRIICPSTAINAITVGSISEGVGVSSPYAEKEMIFGRYKGFPSAFTRVGFGFNKSIKPELVEIGGDQINPRNISASADNCGVGVIGLNNDIKSGYFSTAFGTSISAAKISNLIAKLWSKYPTYSSDLIKSLIVNSAFIPETCISCSQKTLVTPNGYYRCEEFDEEMVKRVYGYGIPNLDNILSSDNNRVILLDDSDIGLNDVVFYKLPLPSEFFNTPGEKEISISLSYAPKVRVTREVYQCCTLKFNLKKNLDESKITAMYSITDDDIALDDSDRRESRVDGLKPNFNDRVHSTLQKAIWKSTDVLNWNDSIWLVIECKDNQWLNDESYRQKYAIVVTVKHRALDQLHELVQEKLRIRIKS